MALGLRFLLFTGLKPGATKLFEATPLAVHIFNAAMGFKPIAALVK